MRTLAILLAIWIVITAVNLNKAFHVDDTAHLEIARWILAHPLRPMSGEVNWLHSAAPIHLLNQPPLYFYLLALWGHLFGFGEISLHLMQSLFSLACIVLAYLIASEFSPSRALLVTLLFAFNPAFVVGQNLMTDVPLLALWMAFFLCLITDRFRSEGRRFVLAGLMAALACLVKYTSLALVLIMVISLLLRRRRDLLWSVLIPVLTLVAWSLFNLLDYGGVHILSRQVGGRDAASLLAMVLTYAVCLGGIMPASFLYYWRPSSGNGRRLGLAPVGWLLLLVSAVLVAYAFRGGLPPHQVDVGLAFVFLCNGLMMALSLYLIFKGDRQDLAEWRGSRELILALWIVVGSVFVMAFAPFMAARHALLAVFPVTLLLAGGAGAPRWRVVDVMAVAGSAWLSLSLAFADKAWANYYRLAAGMIRRDLPADARVYFSGHWGWQWYAREAGMRQFDLNRTVLRPGDILVLPLGIAQQRLPRQTDGIRLRELKAYAPSRQQPEPSLSSRGAFASFYYMDNYLTPPWSISRKPYPPIVVFQVEATASR